MANQQQHVRNVIGACSQSLCNYALHISTTYNSRNPIECVSQMTDSEWTAWTTQPGAIRAVYHKLMTQPSNRTAAGLIQLQFEINADKQLNAVADILDVA